MKNTHSWLNKFLRQQEIKQLKVQEELVVCGDNLVPNREIYRNAIERLNKIRRSRAGINVIRRMFWIVHEHYSFYYFIKHQKGDLIPWKGKMIRADW